MAMVLTLAKDKDTKLTEARPCSVASEVKRIQVMDATDFASFGAPVHEVQEHFDG